MKRIFIVGLLILSAIMLVGCRGGDSGGRPANMDELTYNIGMEALGVVDDFLDGRMSATNARNRIVELQNRIDEVSAPEEPRANQLHRHTSGSLLMMGIQLRGIASHGNSTERLLELRNDLARRLNQSER